MGTCLLVTAALLAQLQAAAGTGQELHDDHSALAIAVVETVGMAVDARQTAAQDVEQEELASTALQQMINIRLAMNKLATASARLRPFTASANDDVAEVAGGSSRHINDSEMPTRRA